MTIEYLVEEIENEAFAFFYRAFAAWLESRLYLNNRRLAERSEGKARLFLIQSAKHSTRKFLVAMRLGETPVLISNTMVKT